MKKITRIAAAVLAFSMVVPLIAGCKKRAKEPVSTDDLWYNLTSVQIASEVDRTQYEYVGIDYVGMTEDTFVFKISGSLKADESSGTEVTPVEELRIYDMSGNLTNTIPYRSLLNNLPDCDGGYFANVQLVDDTVVVNITGYKNDASGNKYFVASIDINTSTIGTPEELPESQEEYVARLRAQRGNRENPLNVGSYRIEKFFFSNGDTSSYVLVAVDDHNAATEFDLRVLFPQDNIYNVTAAFDIGSDRILLVANLSEGRGFYILNTANMTLTKDTSDTSWLVSGLEQTVDVPDAGTFVTNSDGLYRINYDAHTLEPAFLYSYSNINIYEVKSFRPCQITDTRAVFAGEQYSPIVGTYAPVMMYVFDKAATNPNAGKTYLDVASATSYTYALCDAVCTFNETNSSYFIRFNTSYNIDTANRVSSTITNPNQQNAGSPEDRLGNQLAIDIMSGTGPDIIVNGTMFGMLNTDDYLIDLSDYVANNFSSADYFTNIFDAAKNGEELYQVPLSINIKGIITNKIHVGDNQIGFTYDQYQQFVMGPCNGSGPMTGGRIDFFVESLNCMNNLIYSDGHAYYDSEAFRSLAEYTVENINENLIGDKEDTEQLYDKNNSELFTVTNISQYFDSVRVDNNTFLGLPTYDGRGPIMVSADSVAISAQTQAPDACKEFLNILLGQQAQEWFGVSTGVPINRAAFEAVGDKFIHAHNDKVLDMKRQHMSPSDMRNYGVNPEALNSESITEFADLVSGLNVWYVDDRTINAIIREEMPAYFEGQKPLDQVISVLSNRVQTMLNERG